MASDNVVARFTDAQTGLVNGLLYGSGKLVVMSGEAAKRNIESFENWRDAVQAMTATAPVNGAEPVGTLVPILGAASFPQVDEPAADAAHAPDAPVVTPVVEKAKRGRKPRASQTPTPAAQLVAAADRVANDAPQGPPEPEQITIDTWREQARELTATSEALLRVGLKTRAGMLDAVAESLFHAANLYAVEAGLQPQA